MFKKKPNIIRLLIEIIIIVVAFILVYSLNNTTLFADIATKKDGYLTLDDYLIREVDDINSYKNHSNQLLNYDYALMYYSDDGQTSKGLKIGDDINKFISLYGSYLADYIDVYDANYLDEDRDDSYYTTHYFENLTTNDFFNKHYTVSEFIENGYMLTIRYYAYVRFNEVDFGYKGCSRLYDIQDRNAMPKGSIFNPKVQAYCLSFEFYVIDGKLVLETVNSYRYN